MLLRRSMRVRPSAMRRSSSTERISEPSCSFWLRFWASSLSSSSRCDAVDGAVEEIDRRPKQVLEVGFEARVSRASRSRASKMSATAPAMALASGSGRGSGSSWNGR